HTPEEPVFDDRSLAIVQALERLLQRKQALEIHITRQVLPRDRGVLPFAAPLRGPPPASMIDEDLAHRTGGDRQEMRAVAWLTARTLEKLQIGLMDQRRGVQRMPRLFTTQLPLRDPPELRVDEREQLIEGIAIAVAHPTEQTRHASA